MAVPANTFSLDQILGMIDQSGKSAGLSSDQINAAKAVARAEGAGGQQIGDNGTSFGPFQFHIGGMLDGFASWLHDQGYVSGFPNSDQAGTIAQQDPILAVEYALENGGYLNAALQDGTRSGHSGLNLALYAEQFGQRAAQDANGLRSDIVANVTAAWTALFGNGSSLSSGGVPLPVATGASGGVSDTPTPTQTAPTWTIAPGVNIALPNLNPKDTASGLGSVATSISQAAQAVAAIPTGINNAVSSVLGAAVRAGWVLLGLVIVGLGFWLMSKGTENGQSTVSD